MKIVTAAIVERAGRYLVTRRASGQSLSGFWEFPGGKLQPEETLQQCLQRELFEELGVTSRVGKLLVESHFKYDHGEILLKALEAELLEQELTLSVHDEVRWLPADEILNLQLAPADIPIAQFLNGHKNGL